MASKRDFWNGVLVLLSAVNLVAVWFAARPGEPWHAATHAALALGFGLWAMSRMRPEQRRDPVPTQLSDERLERIERAIESVALEVERIGEGQRFASKILGARASELEASAVAQRPEPSRPVPPP